MTTIRQDICLTGQPYDYAWRNDGILLAPILIYPRDVSNICLGADGDYDSQIVFSWSPVLGATQYIVEWCDNANFTGSSVKAAITSDTTYVLSTTNQVRVGETLFWRVFARNGTGLVSDKSITRQVTFNCPGNGQLGRENDFDVNVLIHGDDYMRCCESKMWSSEISFICQNQAGIQVADIANVEWSISTEGNDFDPEILESNDDTAIIQACGNASDVSQIFEITLTVTFNDLIRGGTFQASGTKKVFLDCHTRIEDQPWAARFDEYPLLSVPYEYYDAPLGDLTYAEFEAPYEYAVYSMATLVGPVYKVPVDLGLCPRDHIELECCDCFPPALAFDITTDLGQRTGILKFNGTTLTYSGDGDTTSGICDSANLTLELVCEDGSFKLVGTETCSSACTGDICGDGLGAAADSLVLSWERIDCGYSEVLDSGEFELTQDSLGLYSSNLVLICPEGSPYYVEIDLTGPVKIYIHKLEISGFAITDTIINGGDPDDLLCGSEEFTATYTAIDDCCFNIYLYGALCDASNVYDFETEPFLFEDCSQPSSNHTVNWLNPADEVIREAIINLREGDGDPYCQCNYGEYGIQVEQYALEARVNIPLSCGLKFEDGVISLDLDNLLGNGLRQGYREDGCPYIFVDWRAGTQYCCDYGCYCCTYDDLFICVDGDSQLVSGNGEPTPPEVEPLFFESFKITTNEMFFMPDLALEFDSKNPHKRIEITENLTISDISADSYGLYFVTVHKIEGDWTVDWPKSIIGTEPNSSIKQLYKLYYDGTDWFWA